MHSHPVHGASSAIVHGGSPAIRQEAVQVRILYCNVTGLHRDKALDLMDRADKDTLLFVGETWHCESGLATLGADLYLTTPEAKVRGWVDMGHRHGGLALWAGSRVRGLISISETTPYSISVTLGGRMVHAVYIPESVPDNPAQLHSFKTYLRPRSGGLPDIILGDINIHFGSAFGDKSTGPKARLDVFNDFITEHSITHLRPAANSPRGVTLDHVLIRPGITAGFVAHDPGRMFKTCHPILEVHAAWNRDVSVRRPDPDIKCMDDPLLQPTMRLQLKYLDNEKRKRALLWHWHRAYPKVLAALKKARHHLDPGSAQGTINKADRLIGRTLWDVTSRAFGTYSATGIKSQPDYLGQGLESSPSASSAVRQYRRSQRGSQAVLVSRYPESRTVSEDAMAFYGELYTPDVPEDFQMPFRPLRQPEPDPELLKAFHLDAVQRSIQDYPVARSAGPDGIHPVLIKALAEDGLGQLLAHLFELCARSGLTPLRWNTSLVHPIPKGAATAHANVPDAETSGVRQNEFRTIEEMRPISLTVLFRRLFEKCLLASFSPADNLFHPAQAGFRSGHSTVSHALVAHTDAAQGGECYQVFIDLKQAYDRTAMTRLFNKLSARGMHPAKLALIYSLSIGTRSYINVNGTMSPTSFERIRGLFQGSLLAPYLFNVYIDDLPNEVNIPTEDESDDATQTLLYADDLKLRASTREKLKEMLQRLENWCTVNSMTINVDKSAELIEPDREETWPLKIGNRNLPEVTEYAYLGFPHRYDGVDFPARCRTNLKKATGMLRYLATIGRRWTPAVRLSVYKTLARPLLDYGGALLWHMVFERPPTKTHARWHVSHRARPEQTVNKDKWTADFDAHHKEAVIWIADRSTDKNPVHVLSSVLGLNHPRERMYKLAVMLRQHMLGLEPTSVATLRITELEGPDAVGTPWETGLIARTRSAEILERLPNVDDTRTILDLLPKTPVHPHNQLRAYMVRALNVPSSRLIQYILPSARLPVPLSRPAMTEPRPDALLFIEDRETRTRAIEWRINRFCARTRCSGCGEILKRSCIDECAAKHKCYPEVSESDRRSLDRAIAAFQPALAPPKRQTKKKKEKGKKKKGDDDESDEEEGKKRKGDDDESDEDEGKKKEPHVFTTHNYTRPDDYLNKQRYSQFRKLMVYIDRLNRKTQTAHELKEARTADKTRAQKKKEKAAQRHARNAVPVPEPDTDTTMAVHDGTPVIVHEPRPPPAPRRRVMPPRAETGPPHPPGCTTRTYMVNGRCLPNTVEQYAVLDPRLFDPTLKEPDKDIYRALGLGIPSRIERQELRRELNARAAGQGVLFHNPHLGKDKGYDPSKPFKDVGYDGIYALIQAGTDSTSAQRAAASTSAAL